MGNVQEYFSVVSLYLEFFGENIALDKILSCFPTVIYEDYFFLIFPILQPRKNEEILINKSRCGSINSYLCETSRCYNDLDLVYDKEIFKQLRNAGIFTLHMYDVNISGSLKYFIFYLNFSEEERKFF